MISHTLGALERSEKVEYMTVPSGILCLLCNQQSVEELIKNILIFICFLLSYFRLMDCVTFFKKSME